MDKYVVSRELAEKLKAAGYPQNTEFNWCRSSMSDQPFKLHRKGQIETRELKERYAAPLSDELLEQLPDMFGAYELAIAPSPWDEDKWLAGYLWFGEESGWQEYKEADKPADALAQLWLWCKDNGYIK